MAVHSFKKVQNIPSTIALIWDFFSDPAKLPLITPPSMRFKVISTFQGDRIYPGQLIEYTLTPLLGIRVYWMTEITHVVDGVYFTDEQRRGPYRLWHHQHHFKQIAGGVEMTDLVHYELPLGPLGALFGGHLVKRKLEQLFEYRYQRVEEIFGHALQSVGP